MKKIFYYTQKGQSHIARGIVNQDAVFSMNSNGVEVLAVADGVGSCKNAHIGSNFVVRFISEYACNNFEKLANMSNQELKTLINTEFELRYSDYIEVKTALSTLLLVAKKGSMLLVIQIGDGKILCVAKGSSSQIFQDDGLPMNQSYTWNSNSDTFCKSILNSNQLHIDFVLLCTDGVYKPSKAPVEFNNGLSYLDPAFTYELYRRNDDVDYQNFINTVVTASNGHYGDLDDKTAGLMIVR